MSKSSHNGAATQTSTPPTDTPTPAPEAAHTDAADAPAAPPDSPEVAPPAASPAAPPVKRRRLRFWRAPLARLKRSWLYRSRLVRLVVGLGMLAIVMGIIAFGILRVLGPRDKIKPFTLPFVEEFATVEVNTWLTRGGVWNLRQDALAQLANLEKQAQIYLPYKLAADQPYHISAYVIFGGSTRAAGVNFNAQYPDITKQQHQVYIARTEATTAEDGALPPPAMELIAGYTDENGEFVRQVTVPFDLDTVQYRLDVYVLGNNYTVQLNGQTMIERRPVFYANGLVGFVAEGPARFDTLRITTAQTRDPGEQVYVSDFDQTPGGAGWVPLSGAWEVSDGELVQANPAAQDAAIGYEGSAFENYVVQTSFRHLVGVGGGLLFNMASPYQLNASYIVRYSEQTDSVFWGFFDESGLFTRQGYFETPPAGTDTHVLAVYVGIDSYDIYLDEQLLARNIPYQGAIPATEEGRSGGHIGLITSRSSVAYAMVEVFPLFDNSQMKMPQPQAVQPATTPAAAASAPTATKQPAAPKPTVTTAVAAAAAPVTAAENTAQPAAPTVTPRAAATPAIRAADATPLPDSSRAIVQGAAAPWTPTFRGDLTDASWRIISGDWGFSNDALAQRDPTGIDYAITYVGNAFQNYTYAASFTHGEGNAAGILFNMPYTDRINGAHMVRYSERRPGGIFWGYFDAAGKFVGQGYANVDPPADARHSLRVVSRTDRYDIYLDDFVLATDLPLQQNYGYVGLVTVLSTARFDAITVAGLADDAVQTLPGLATFSAGGVYSDTGTTGDSRIVSGQWEIGQGIYRQITPDPADYVLNTGVYAAQYRIESDIMLPVKPESGGGFMLHMPERGRKNGATVVRFINGGDGLFWGVYDASGAFVGRDSIDLTDKYEGDNLYRLTADVRGDAMDILVDDEVVASGIVLPRTEGWVGLVAHGGPVTFSDLQITVEGIQ